MEKLPLILLTLFFSFQIIRHKGRNRLFWFIAGFLFCSNRIIIVTSPYIPSHRLLVFSLMISELIRYRNFKHNWRKFPLKKSIIFVAIAYILIGLMDQRLSTFLKLYRPIYHTIETFFILFLAFASIENTKDLNWIIKRLTPLVIFIMLFGIFNFITKQNPYDQLISSAFSTESAFEVYKTRVGDRFRINSFADHPITYGYICAVLATFYIFLPKRNHTIKRPLLISTVTLLIINLLFSNSRSPLLAFLLGVTLIITFVFNLKTKFKLMLLAIPLFILSYLTIPFINEKVDAITDVFLTGGENQEGSSMDMRYTQLAASYVLAMNNPIWGNGFAYIQEDLGWNSEDKEYSSELRGFESYIFVLLIETGLIGIIANLSIFLIVISYLFKKKRENKRLSAIAIALVFMFLTFILATGTLNSWLISMTFIGILIKVLELEKHDHNQNKTVTGNCYPRLQGNLS